MLGKKISNFSLPFALPLASCQSYVAHSSPVFCANPSLFFFVPTGGATLDTFFPFIGCSRWPVVILGSQRRKSRLEQWKTVALHFLFTSKECNTVFHSSHQRDHCWLLLKMTDGQQNRTTVGRILTSLSYLY